MTKRSEQSKALASGFTMSPLTLPILRTINGWSPITISQVVALCGMNEADVRREIKKLVASHIVKTLGRSKLPSPHLLYGEYYVLARATYLKKLVKNLKTLLLRHVDFTTNLQAGMVFFNKHRKNKNTVSIAFSMHRMLVNYAASWMSTSLASFGFSSIMTPEHDLRTLRKWRSGIRGESKLAFSSTICSIPDFVAKITSHEVFVELELKQKSANDYSHYFDFLPKDTRLLYLVPTATLGQTLLKQAPSHVIVDYAIIGHTLGLQQAINNILPV